MFMRPIPPELGIVQCTIIRNSSGMNKFWPKYTLKLSGDIKNVGMMLEAKKIAQSKTPHYRIVINTGISKYSSKEEEDYLGRLRSNHTKSEYHLYDSGAKDQKELDKMKGKGALRKQLGMVFYQEDNLGVKGPRRLEVYLPLIDPKDPNPTFACWEDDESKKQTILM